VNYKIIITYILSSILACILLYPLIQNGSNTMKLMCIVWASAIGYAAGSITMAHDMKKAYEEMLSIFNDEDKEKNKK